MSAEFSLVATCAFGLEAIVRRELEALGYACQISGPGQVHFQGDEAAICRANLWLRTADRVLIQLAQFDADNFDALFEGVRNVALAQWIPRDGEFPVGGRSLNSQLTSVPAIQRTVKKAAVENLLKAHQTSTLPESAGVYKLEIALNQNVARLTLDTTGPSLHKRGYRLHAGGAPLKETLAAALVSLSFWNRERPLIDPFCGSGTIPIEAALVGQNIAPGRRREFAAEGWPILNSAVWRDARTEADSLVRPGLEENLWGGDIDRRALQAARENAERAGVADLIHFQQRDFHDLSSKRKYGCVITNPPYGERLGEIQQLEPLYRSLPAVLRKLPTWSHFILTSYPRFESVIERKADRRRKLYNGRIECTYYQFHGPKAKKAKANDRAIDPTEEAGQASSEPQDSSKDESAVSPKPAAVSTPVFGGVDAKAKEQAEIFRSRLIKRARHLRRWPTKRNISCFRLYERDVPEIPLVVDRYEDRIHITEYERPHDRDLGRHADWLELMAKTAGEALEAAPQHVFLKSRERQRGAAQHLKVASERNETIVHEGGLQFIVNLSDYIDTGLFLDHRVTRSMVRDASAGTNFLNLFAYTGSFSVYAASGGARRTTTVDWNPTYLDWARRNMQLNEFEGPQHRFAQADALSFLRDFPRDSEPFDLAVVDPPTFSNSKRSEADWRVQHDHPELLRELLARMAAGGVIYFSTNFRRFKLDESLEDDVAEIREISAQTVPEDFRNRRIHRCWRIVANE